jgi:hypothetical protein
MGIDSEQMPSPPVPEPTRTRNWKPLIIGAFVLALVVIGLLVWLVIDSRGGTVGPLAEKHTITGSLSATECGGGFDIANASVEIRDETDKLIGAGTTTGNQTQGAVGCVVNFSIPDVPKAQFYQVTIGSHGGPTYSYGEMKAAGWNLDLTL